MWRALTFAGILMAGSAVAQTGGDSAQDGRPSEDALFGGTPQVPGAEVPAAPASPAATPDGRPSDDDIFGSSSGDGEAAPGTVPAGAPPAPGPSAMGIVDRFGTDEAKEDGLDIGGLFYQRFSSTTRKGQGLNTTVVSAPTMVDAYFDARPTDRLRANITARLNYDSMQGAASRLTSSLTGGEVPDNPSILLDQLWLRFDVLRTVFVTAGKQHVKWGTARFWNPTDFLHPQRRDSLAQFDARTGTNLIKLHLPIESNGSNFYGVMLLDDFAGDTAGTVGGIGGALRAEWVLGTAEFGLTSVFQKNRRPRYGADFSSALGPIDLYAEAALRAGPYLRYEQVETDFGPSLALEEHGSRTIAAAGGANWTFAYSDKDTATVGVEYFYNQAGYENADLYEGLLFRGGFQPLYTGQHYGSIYALIAGPGSFDDTNITLSNLGNLSDRSFVTRLDVTQRVLSYLTVEANAAAYYGNPDGEFRMRLDVPGMQVGEDFIEGFTVPQQRFSFGVGLRMEF